MENPIEELVSLVAKILKSIEEALTDLTCSPFENQRAALAVIEKGRTKLFELAKKHQKPMPWITKASDPGRS